MPSQGIEAATGAEATQLQDTALSGARPTLIVSTPSKAPGRQTDRDDADNGQEDALEADPRNTVVVNGPAEVLLEGVEGMLAVIDDFVQG